MINARTDVLRRRALKAQAGMPQRAVACLVNEEACDVVVGEYGLGIGGWHGF